MDTKSNGIFCPDGINIERDIGEITLHCNSLYNGGDLFAWNGYLHPLLQTGKGDNSLRAQIFGSLHSDISYHIGLGGIVINYRLFCLRIQAH